MPMSTTSPPILIGFAGGSGAGKTTLVSSIQKRLGNHRATIFSLDWYYKDINIQKDSLYYLNVTVCDQDDNNRDSHFNIRGYDPNNKLYSSILTEQFK